MTSTATPKATVPPEWRKAQIKAAKDMRDLYGEDALTPDQKQLLAAEEKRTGDALAHFGAVDPPGAEMSIEEIEAELAALDAKEVPLEEYAQELQEALPDALDKVKQAAEAAATLPPEFATAKAGEALDRAMETLPEPPKPTKAEIAAEKKKIKDAANAELERLKVEGEKRGEKIKAEAKKKKAKKAAAKKKADARKAKKEKAAAQQSQPEDTPRPEPPKERIAAAMALRDSEEQIVDALGLGAALDNLDRATGGVINRESVVVAIDRKIEEEKAILIEAKRSEKEQVAISTTVLWPTMENIDPQTGKANKTWAKTQLDAALATDPAMKAEHARVLEAESRVLNLELDRNEAKSELVAAQYIYRTTETRAKGVIAKLMFFSSAHI